MATIVTALNLTPLPPDSPIYTLHRQFWGRPIVFNSCNDGEGRCYETLKLSVPIPRSDIPVTEILIRKEYLDLFKDLKSYYTMPRKIRTTSADEEEDEERGSVSPQRLRSVVDYAPAVVVIGHPGIGKTVALWVVLLHCLSESRSIVLQLCPNVVYYLSPQGAFSTSVEVDPDIWDRFIPPTTWILVDSNDDLHTVSTNVSNIRRPILQAASPRKDRIAWRKKHNSASTLWIMRPMTVSELRACAKILLPGLSLAKVELFHELFGPATRPLLKLAEEIDVYEQELESTINHIQEDTLQKIVDDAGDMNYMYNSVPDNVVFATPGEYRHESLVDFVSDHVMTLVSNRAASVWKEDNFRLYTRFAAVPNCRPVARRVYEKAVHARISAGGVWSVRVMRELRSSRKYKTYSVTHPNVQYLQIGAGHVLEITDHQPAAAQSLGRLDVLLYKKDLAANMALDSKYYQPRSASEEAFDSFVYDHGRNVVTVFKCTITAVHDVKFLNSKWWKGLHGKGRTQVPVVDYVVVTADNRIELEVTHPASSFFRNFYHLCLLADRSLFNA